LALLPPGLREAAAPLALEALLGGFQTLLQVAGVVALIFAVLVGALLQRPLPTCGSAPLVVGRR